MAHESRLVTGIGPGDSHAFDGIPRMVRGGDLDAPCPVCRGHGQWNNEFDLASQRSKRTICPHCEGRGWIETGRDPVSTDDIVMTDERYPDWVVRLEDPPIDDDGADARRAGPDA